MMSLFDNNHRCIVWFLRSDTYRLSVANNNNSYFQYIRCILKGFAKSYQVKILSNRNIQYREFSQRLDNYIGNSSFLSEPQINSWFVTGFADAESSFSVTIRSNPRHNT